MASNILQELLVQLKVKDSKPDSDRLVENIRNASIQANLVIDGLGAALNVIETIMGKVTEHVDRLYFMSQRTKTSIGNIEALGYAAKQTGSDVNEMQATIESFAYRLKVEPGMARNLEMFGVDLKSTKEVGDMIVAFIDNLKAKFDEPTQLHYAEKYGIPYHLFNAFTRYKEERNKYHAEELKIREKLHIPEDIGEKLHRLADGLNRVQMIMGVIFEKFVSTLMNPAGDAVESFGDFMLSHGRRIASVLTAMVGAVMEIASGFARWMDRQGLALDKVDTWRKIFIGVGIAITAIALPKIFSLMTALYGAMAFVASNPWVLAVLGIAGGAYAIHKYGIGGLMEKWGQDWGRVGRNVASGNYGIFGGHGGGASGPDISVKNPVAVKEMYDYLRKEKGLDHEHAMGMLMNAGRESTFNSGAFNPNDNGGPSGGLFQFHNDRFTKMRNFVQGDWHKNWKQQIDYALTEREAQAYLKSKFSSADEASVSWIRNFEKPQDASGGAAYNRRFYGSIMKAIGGAAQAAPVKPDAAPTPLPAPKAAEAAKPIRDLLATPGGDKAKTTNDDYNNLPKPGEIKPIQPWKPQALETGTQQIKCKLSKKEIVTNMTVAATGFPGDTASVERNINNIVEASVRNEMRRDHAPSKAPRQLIHGAG